MAGQTSKRSGPPIDRLTVGQSECLRLVAQLQSSKQIGRRLGISNYTVDQRVARAVRTLGAANRADAALMVVAFEKAERFHSVSETVPVAPGAEQRPAFPQIGSSDEAGEAYIVDTTAYQVGNKPSSAFLPLPIAGRINDMSFAHRLAWAAAIAAAGVVVVGILLASLAAIRTLS